MPILRFSLKLQECVDFAIEPIDFEDEAIRWPLQIVYGCRVDILYVASKKLISVRLKNCVLHRCWQVRK
jgi:hypothetical protein